VFLHGGMGVLDFGGDCRRGRGSLGVNTMQKWRIDRLSTRVSKVNNISIRRCDARYARNFVIFIGKLGSPSTNMTSYFALEVAM